MPASRASAWRRCAGSASKIALVGSDTWATEVVPPEDPDRPYPVHLHLLVRNGIYNLENLDLEELASDKVHEFAFVFAPLLFKGATARRETPLPFGSRASAWVEHEEMPTDVSPEEKD